MQLKSTTMSACLLTMALAAWSVTPAAADCASTCKTMIEQKCKDPSITSQPGYTFDACVSMATTQAYPTCLQQCCSQLPAKGKDSKDRSCQ